jgi:FkbM family methyltransferase
VLDIGANIGQFSVTLASMFPELNIYSFEANPDIFDLLSKNTSRFNSIHAISKAVGPEGVMPFYYVPGKSAKGSFVRSNAVINIDGSTVKKVDIDVVELNHFGAQDIELPKKYDLIKIDVEGFEYVVLDALNGIKTDYIYIEFSQALRNPNYSIHDLLDKIRAIFGKCDVIFCDEINREETIGNLLAKVT